jgi:hypothetical protein
MNRTRNNYLWFVAVLGFAQSLAVLPAVENSPSPVALAQPDAGVASRSAPQRARSPVERFRELLAADPAERAALLAKDPATREKKMAKLQEYEALEPEERELRLQVTELRWYLWPLLDTPPASRAAALAAIPLEFRQLVSNRLQWWDMLAPPLQNELLENEATIWYVTDLACRLTNGPPPVPKEMSAEEAEQFQKWQDLGEEQRRRITVRFNQVFQLTDEDQQKTLRHLSEPEQRQIEKTLRTFENLTPELRQQCLASFETFNGLTPAGRQQFLKNAARWKLMTPSERQAWIDLVNRLSSQPPPPSDLPPLPPSFSPPGAQK